MLSKDGALSVILVILIVFYYFVFPFAVGGGRYNVLMIVVASISR